MKDDAFAPHCGKGLVGCNWAGQQHTVGHGPKIEADEDIGLHTLSQTTQPTSDRLKSDIVFLI